MRAMAGWGLELLPILPRRAACHAISAPLASSMGGPSSCWTSSLWRRVYFSSSTSTRRMAIFDSRFPFLRRQAWLYITASLTLLGILGFAFVAPNSAERVQGLLAHVKGKGSKPGAEEKKPEFYTWKTRSPFEPVQLDNWRNASTAELCDAFPSFLMNEVQPVLKTGHGVLEQRVRPQLETSLACLNSLLTFSDVTEQFENLHLIDVLEDIPQELIDSDEQAGPYRRLQECVASGSKECGDVMTHKEAWNMDKFKFLPMATRAWKMRPERRWYVFFEADTMLFWDNIFRLVGNFDADVPLYFGSPSPGREGTWFAYGGSSFILSREAMRRLVSHDWDKVTGEYLSSRLTELHWHTLLHDCCGDSVLGWALHEAGVSLGGLWPMFNPHPPHGVPFSDLYWCQPMIGMHKPNVDDVQTLFRWEYGFRQYDVSCRLISNV